MNFVWRDRQGHLAAVSAAHPRKDAALRNVLLHDPGAFRHLPKGTGDLVLSGHTHRAEAGLVSLGLSFTMLRLFGIRIPDHGFLARSTERMSSTKVPVITGFRCGSAFLRRRASSASTSPDGKAIDQAAHRDVEGY